MLPQENSALYNYATGIINPLTNDQGKKERVLNVLSYAKEAMHPHYQIIIITVESVKLLINQG